ncbi:MAG TPA: signal peptidase I [Verrucomicrobiae bacterium]|nr:signal peptidase I [Verrucomicrobiae bacterium]
MNRFKTIALWAACIIGICYLASAAAYLAGYRTYRFPTRTMEPTIRKNERAIGRLSERYRDHIARFDVAIFRDPRGSGEIYAKRIVGLPGEHITTSAQGVTINGRGLNLPAAVSVSGLQLKTCDLVIPTDTVFILGDHTENSLDSRYLGPIRTADVIGYMVFKK